MVITATFKSTTATAMKFTVRSTNTSIGSSDVTVSFVDPVATMLGNIKQQAADYINGQVALEDQILAEAVQVYGGPQ